jgi:hypothetical protein
LSKILTEVFNELKLEHIDYTERKFSREMLGADGSYMAHLKSYNKEPSHRCILTLWATLGKQKQRYELYLPVAKEDYLKHMTKNWIDLYGRLENRVFNEMKNYAVELI